MCSYNLLLIDCAGELHCTTPKSSTSSSLLNCKKSKIRLQERKYVEANDDSDLLCRVREDLHNVHQDLVQRISAVHNDLHRLMGVSIPDLDQALGQQAKRKVHLLEIPADIDERLYSVSLSDRLDPDGDGSFGLRELSDSFILNYNKSTVLFRSGLLVTERIPPLDQYLNLLKCVWIFKRIAVSPSLVSPERESHWPSYARQLEDASLALILYGE